MKKKSPAPVPDIPITDPPLTPEELEIVARITRMPDSFSGPPQPLEGPYKLPIPRIPLALEQIVYWCSLPLWTLREACALALQVPLDSGDDDELGILLRAAERDAEAVSLPTTEQGNVQPSHFIAWCGRRGIAFPKALRDAVNEAAVTAEAERPRNADRRLEIEREVRKAAKGKAILTGPECGMAFYASGLGEEGNTPERIKDAGKRRANRHRQEMRETDPNFELTVENVIALLLNAPEAPRRRKFD